LRARAGDDKKDAMSTAAAPRPDRYTVIIRDLVVMASIGIRRSERERKQRVRISVELTATPAATFPGEDRRNVLNYEKVLTTIRHLVREGHVDLCETLAERICSACFADSRVAHMRATVEKLDVFLETESVGAILERNRPA
jgi:dihydroneopterin aldolase